VKETRKKTMQKFGMAASASGKGSKCQEAQGAHPNPISAIFVGRIPETWHWTRVPPTILLCFYC